MTDIHHILYTSTLSPYTPVTAVAAILGSARRYNLKAGITGILVFDGINFCQYLEGDAEAIAHCTERIRRDARHGGFQMLHQGEMPARRFERFSLGYATTDTEAVIAHLSSLRGPAAWDYFEQLLPTLDLD